MTPNNLLGLKSYLEDRLKGTLLNAEITYGELNIFVKTTDLLNVLFFLRDDRNSQFVALIDISGADYPNLDQRFAVNYHLLSPRLNLRIRVKVFVAEEEAIASAVAVYPGAEWYEREIYDLFGVLFIDHPDLRRLLTDYGFQGHPLRKDFPTTGFVECRYDNELKRIVYEPVKLRQEMRNFDFLSPWDGPEYHIESDKIEDNNDGA